MQNLITILIFVILLLLLSVLPAFDRGVELQRQTAPRVPVVSLDRGM